MIIWIDWGQQRVVNEEGCNEWILERANELMADPTNIAQYIDDHYIASEVWNWDKQVKEEKMEEAFQYFRNEAADEFFDCFEEYNFKDN